MKPFVTRFLIRFIVNSSILSFEQNILVQPGKFQKQVFIKIKYYSILNIFNQNKKMTFFEKIGQTGEYEFKLILWFSTDVARSWSKISQFWITVFLVESKFSLFSKIFHQEWNSQRICIIILV